MKKTIKLGSRKIVLGAKYQDKVHSIKGVATAATQHLNGCDQVCLERIDNDDRLTETWFDITQIEGIKVKKKETGGPRSTPPSRHHG